MPTSTYRLQVNASFGFGDAAAQAGYLRELGVSHAYLSPVLQAVPGSAHGYDVVDHARLSAEAGGDEGFSSLVHALHAAGLGAVADVVPNHMAVPTPAWLNAALWSVLREGPASAHARWFDVDWSVPDRAILMPVLGSRIGQVLQDGELTADVRDGEPVLRYHDHVFPVRPGTEHLPLAELVDRQWYRLAHWRVAEEELNYRRFFDVDTLAALRVEDPQVFRETHRLLLALVADGSLDGLRIDHPDGLADPAGYLSRLAEETGGAWVVVEKILEGDEELPDDWACAGTTGYDALAKVAGLFLDPAGAAPLATLLSELTDQGSDFALVVDAAKREILAHGQYAEVHRLVDLLAGVCHDDVLLRDHTWRALHEAVTELLVAMDRYRAYVRPPAPGEKTGPPFEARAVLADGVQRARAVLPPERHDTLDVVRDLLLGLPIGSEGRLADPRRAEVVVRFQQTCGPVMAKGVEDTAFYRWFRLVGLNEVGGDPTLFGVTPEDFHAFAARLAADWPLTMTTLSTHDTKRAEDVRARLAVLAEIPDLWAQAVRGWHRDADRHRLAHGPDAATEYLLWQTLIATWGGRGLACEGPISGDRLADYLTKAMREAKQRTSWTAPDAEYEDAVLSFAAAVLGDPELMADVEAFCWVLSAPARVATLGQKLVQLLMPGVPDVYQGCETVDLSLVDPDNRRPVDFARRAALLASIDSGGPREGLEVEKLLVTSRALRLRREHPDWFVGPGASYTPVATSTGNAVAFARGTVDDGPRVVAVVTRLPVALDRLGGWADHTLVLPAGQWRDALAGPAAGASPEADTKAAGLSGTARLAELLNHLPVSLLVRA